MALEIFKLVGSIMVNNSAANQSISETDKKAEGVGNTLLKGVGTAAKWGAAAVAAGTAAAGAMVAAANKTAEQADEIDKMSQKLGMSREAYQEWDYVLAQAGVDINSMQTGMKTLTNQIDDAKNGSEDAAARFAELGVSMEDLQNSSREDIFAKVVAGMQSLEDTTGRAALANDLFGKSGQNLIPLFNESAESTKELKDSAKELGLVLGDDMIDNGVKLHDTMDTLKRSFSAVGASIGAELVPIVDDFANLIIDNMPVIKEVIAGLAPVLTDTLGILLPALKELGGALFPVVIEMINQLLPFVSELAGAVMPVLAQLLKTLLPPLIQIAQMVLPILIQLLEPIFPLLAPIIELLNPLITILMALIQPMMQILDEILPVVVEILTDLIAMITEQLQPIMEELVYFTNEVLVPAIGIIIEIVRDMCQSVLNYWQKLKDTLTQWMTEMVTNLTNAWHRLSDSASQVVEGMKDKILNTFDTMKQGIKAQINNILEFVNKLINALNSIKIDIPKWVPGLGGKSFHINIPNVPYLAKGGDINEEGLAVVGEAGAELIDLPKGARVTPLEGGGGGSIEEKLNQMVELLGNLIDVLPESVAQGMQELQLEWNERELGRLVKAYE